MYLLVCVVHLLHYLISVCVCTCTCYIHMCMHVCQCVWWLLHSIVSFLTVHLYIKVAFPHATLGQMYLSHDRSLTFDKVVFSPSTIATSTFSWYPLEHDWVLGRDTLNQRYVARFQSLRIVMTDHVCVYLVGKTRSSQDYLLMVKIHVACN